MNFEMKFVFQLYLMDHDDDWNHAEFFCCCDESSIPKSSIINKLIN